MVLVFSSSKMVDNYFQKEVINHIVYNEHLIQQIALKIQHFCTNNMIFVYENINHNEYSLKKIIKPDFNF